MPKPKYEEMSIAEYNELMMRDAEKMLHEAHDDIIVAKANLERANARIVKLIDKFEQMRLEL